MDHLAKSKPKKSVEFQSSSIESPNLVSSTPSEDSQKDKISNKLIKLQNLNGYGSPIERKGHSTPKSCSNLVRSSSNLLHLNQSLRPCRIEDLLLARENKDPENSKSSHKKQELFFGDMDVMREYANYFKHNNVSNLIQKQKKKKIRFGRTERGLKLGQTHDEK